MNCNNGKTLEYGSPICGISLHCVNSQHCTIKDCEAQSNINLSYSYLHVDYWNNPLESIQKIIFIQSNDTNTFRVFPHILQKKMFWNKNWNFSVWWSNQNELRIQIMPFWATKYKTGYKKVSWNIKTSKAFYQPSSLEEILSSLN